MSKKLDWKAAIKIHEYKTKSTSSVFNKISSTLLLAQDISTTSKSSKENYLFYQSTDYPCLTGFEKIEMNLVACPWNGGNKKSRIQIGHTTFLADFTK